MSKETDAIEKSKTVGQSGDTRGEKKITAKVKRELETDTGGPEGERTEEETMYEEYDVIVKKVPRGTFHGHSLTHEIVDAKHPDIKKFYGKKGTGLSKADISIMRKSGYKVGIKEESTMTSFVELAQDSKPSEFQDLLNRTLESKVSAALDDRKVEVAGDFFGEASLNEFSFHVKHGAFHAWLGKSEDEPITDADIEKGLAAGGHAAKMAEFAKAARHFHHKK